MFDDADIAAAAEGIAIAGYFNAGQDCTAATRVIASPGIYADIVAALAEQAAGTKVGKPDDEVIWYGPVNDTTQLAHVSGFPATRGSPPAARASATAGTSSSRPSSPTSTRTTR